MENWKPVPGWESRYLVSDQGAVRSRDMWVCAGVLRAGRLLKLVAKDGRYLCVTLTAQNGRRRQYFVHDLVALAFIGSKPEGHQTRHLDDVKLNNVASNLSYGTAVDNEDDRRRNGRIPHGEKHGCAKLTADSVRAIRTSVEPRKTLAAKYGVHVAHIHAIQTRRVWKHV